LTLSQAPEIRGLRLGLELSRVQDIFPSLRNLTTDEFGVIKEGNVPVVQAADRSKYAGIDFFGLEFLDGHLTSIYVAYDGSATWKSADEFAAKVSESLSLPNAWKKVIVTDKTMARIPTYVHLLDHQRYMECNGFEVRAGIDPEYFHSNVSITGLGAEGVIKRRQMRREEEKRQAFKP
jgi:hypothetical protein